ncbi:hypothetical protein Phou_032570 [Phytohabitans houttuyneae]|uniref:Ferritin-like domain-containing protein n=1 Tax=Phytohabitans houttuyneae TaxID=1076126 RepID=A0A6V8KBJ0_9ACTN|nr:hypothetical protein Phou_032570 [Phytohabitans houttuyneae]
MPEVSQPGSAVVELLGMVGYAELLAFDRMAADARLAPDLRRRAVLSEMAAVEIVNYRRLATRLVEHGADPGEAMTPYVAALQEYHELTEPKDWLEALTKAYVWDGIADDFFREVAAFLSKEDRDLVQEVLHDSQYNDFAAGRSGPRSPPTPRWPTGSRCGPAAWSGKGSPRRSGWRGSGSRSRS